MLADEQDARTRIPFDDAPCGFDAVQARQSDIHQDEIRLQLLGLLKRFDPMRRCANGLISNRIFENRVEVAAPPFVVLDHQDAIRQGHTSSGSDSDLEISASDVPGFATSWRTWRSRRAGQK